MVVGGSQQETLDPGFVLLGTRQRWWWEVVNSETLDPGFVLLGTRQQGVPVILKERFPVDYLQPPSSYHYYYCLFIFVGLCR
ncbi:unnamed protein product [Schistosoma mattheei]|uniref:Uncharacterized protein n=1 Tax=Schistosoma mattheei TaxID=31246 RepID=A0A183PQD2_9TREM|nr:unnamed protein product [Schistosoma mattheei]